MCSFPARFSDARVVQCSLNVAKAVITIAIRLRYHYDTTIPRRIRHTFRLRRKLSKLRFAFDSTAIRQRSDYDVSRAPASIRSDSTRAKMNTSIFRRIVSTYMRHSCLLMAQWRRAPCIMCRVLCVGDCRKNFQGRHNLLTFISQHLPIPFNPLFSHFFCLFNFSL